MKLYDSLKKVDYWLVMISRRVVSVIMIILLVILFSGTVSRYVFNHAIMWVDELSSYLLVLLTMFGCYTALYDNKLAAVTFIVDDMPALPKKVIKAVAHLACVVLLIALAYYSAELCFSPMIKNTRMPTLRWSKIYFYAVMPILSSVMAFHELLVLISVIIGADYRYQPDRKE